MSVKYYRDLLRPIFTDRKIILATGSVVGMGKRAKRICEFGTDRCLLIGSTVGTGVLPDRSNFDWVIALDEPASDMLAGIRNYNAALKNPSQKVVTAIERFDPDGEALVLGSHVSDLQQLAGRPRLGAPKPKWTAMEDKVVIDDFWDRAGVRRAPSQIVDVDDIDTCRRLTTQLDDGAGAAWAGDSRDGLNGGAVYLRRVRTHADIKEAQNFFSKRCDRLRIMPFLEGIPCSIHGIVFPEMTTVFRPVEMVVFRRPDHSTLLYSGFTTWWDPSQEDRDYMRRTARNVGDMLRDEVDYRGAFTMDGIITADGFIPTELNARTGGAFKSLTAAKPELPLEFIETCVRDGIDLDYRPATLEKMVLEIADEHRTGGGWTVLNKPFTMTERHRLRIQRSNTGIYHAELAEEHHIHDGTLSIGPSNTGGFINFSPEDSALIKGPSIAPIVAAVWTLADEKFDTGIGPVVFAGDVR